MKFKRNSSVMYVLLPIMMLAISIPAFYVSFVAKDANNTKKVLQEAAYSAALAGSSAIDVDNFEKGLEVYDGNTYSTIADYPHDTETNSPVSFLKQYNKYVRKGSVISPHDCIPEGEFAAVYDESTAIDLASKEAIQTAETYLQSVLPMTVDPENVNKKIYSASDYCISVAFSREISSSDGLSRGPFNKITVTVSLKYKPILYNSLFGDEVPMYGTSSAISKTIK